MSYSYTWRNKWLTSEAKTVGEMAEALEGAAADLRLMEKAGVTLDTDSDVEDDYAELRTDDAAVAAEFGLEEDEVFDEDEFSEEDEVSEEECP